jgi:hypothetical protein
MKVGSRNQADASATIKMGGRQTMGGTKMGGRYVPMKPMVKK